MSKFLTKEELVGKIKTALKDNSHAPRIRELARRLSIPEPQYRQFRQLVKALRNEALIQARRGKLFLSERQETIIGTYTPTRTGFGFVQPEDGSDEIFIARDRAGGLLLPGDKVEVRLLRKAWGEMKSEGEVLRVLERQTDQLVGVFHPTSRASYVIPDGLGERWEIYIPKEKTKEAKAGEKVVVKLLPHKPGVWGLEGEIVEVLGDATNSEAIIQGLVYSYRISVEFPHEVQRELSSLPAKVGPEELKNRWDFRKKTTFTIDPIDAKDHDDAVSLEKLPNKNWLLGVHIADVSHYVREGTAIDKEAVKRGNSVYLPGRVIPMLPHALSSNLCSLLPEKVRLTYSCMMELTPEGVVKSYEVGRSVIHSAAKLAYEEVQEVFDGGKARKKLSKFLEPLENMLQLSKILLQNRMKKGSLDFDLPEDEVILDDQGRVIDLKRSVRLDSHRLVEEFMLLANQTVARFASGFNLPVLYRVHGTPDEEKMEAFFSILTELGHKFSHKGAITPLRLAHVLKIIAGKPEEELIDEILLRSLKKAVYQDENIGHFGLAFDRYLHFTSPIRRYPDLLVHRLLYEYQSGRLSPHRFEHFTSQARRLGAHCSATERTADELEREAVKVKQLEFMQDKVGEHYAGVVSGVTNFGVFVRLGDMGVEGMIRLRDLTDDYYVLDERGHRLVGRKTKKSIHLGDKISVWVVRVDREAGRIDLIPDWEKEKAEKNQKRHRR
ncbi:MAG: ribonuclease R [candidate division Zixibacteria bacterium]|nr:ribonuclease R [candidate division Zixibacteria bacterium]